MIARLSQSMYFCEVALKIKSSVRGRFPPYFFCPRDVPDTNIHMGMIVDNSLFTETYGRFKGGNRGISVEKI